MGSRGAEQVAQTHRLQRDVSPSGHGQVWAGVMGRGLQTAEQFHIQRANQIKEG